MIAVALLLSALPSKGDTDEDLPLYAHDCTTTKNVNISTISLTQVGPCEDPMIAAPTRNRSVQVIQTNPFEMIKVYSCALSIRRIIFHCGMHSHNSIIGNREWIKDLTPKECISAHEGERIDLYGRTIYNLRRNGSTTQTMVVAGWISADGGCDNQKQFHDFDGTFQDVVVEIQAKILLYDQMARYDTQTGLLHMKSGLAAPYLDGQANDVLTGQAFWTVEPEDNQECSENMFAVLFQGPAVQISSKAPGDSQEDLYVVVDQEETTFAVKIMNEYIRCGQVLYTTEHPGISIAFHDDEKYYFRKKGASHLNAEILTFFQSKMQYMEVRNRMDLTTLHLHSLKRRCEIERQALAQKLALLRTFPEAAGQVLHSGARGVQATVRGESLVVVICPRVKVAFRNTNGTCYNGIPIKYQNQSMFLTPVSHVLTPHAEEVPCSRLAPNLFQIADGWVALTPQPVQIVDEPTILRPAPDISLNFQKMKHIAGKGIFSLQDMRALQKSMLFSSERSAVNSYVANRILGNAPKTSFDSINIFSASDLEKIADTTINKIWGWLSSFGLLSSGFLGILFIIQVIKYVFSVTLRVFHLHRELGCGIWILSAVWSSLANCILHENIKKRLPDNEYHTRGDSPDPPPPPPNSEYVAMFSFPGNEKPAYDEPKGTMRYYPVLPTNTPLTPTTQTPPASTTTASAPMSSVTYSVINHPSEKKHVII